jgi:phosphatidylserine/phosphatidylglycerophosphate/cardiolipin synthase-like enzyme
MNQFRILKYAISTLIILSLLVSVAYALQTSRVKNADIEWAFTQEDQAPEKLIVSIIGSAKSTLDIAIYSLTYPDIVQAIKDAQKRGVTVRLISDKLQSSGKSQVEALKILGSAGVPTKINKHSGLMHLKMIVADKKIATTGSFNFSKAATTDNDEVLLVIRNEETAKAFSDQFEKMWNDDNKFETIKLIIAQDTTTKPDSTTDKTETNSGACTNPMIKGNKDSKIYHVQGGQYYEKTTKNVVMFCS